MALTQKMLQAMDIPSDKIEQIIEAHRDTINGLTAERDALKADIDKYKAEAAELAGVKKELVKAQAKLEDAESTANDFKALKEEYKAFKADVETKASTAAKEKAYRALLAEAGVPDKRCDAIIRVTDLSKVEIDKDGAIADKKPFLDSIKSEWSDFIVTQHQTGAGVATPPANTGGTNISKADIMKIKDTSERQAAIRDYANTHGGW